tara:strand:- start:511 stop:837 length:327 start_codon:yes stop_codon:yes gene_type:complete
MLVWTIQQIILSLLIIVLAHYIYSFLKNNLTTPKIRDMVNVPTKQYKNIYTNAESYNDTNDTAKNLENTQIMKKELQSYLTELKNKNNNIQEPGFQPSNNFQEFPTNY